LPSALPAALLKDAKDKVRNGSHHGGKHQTKQAQLNDFINLFFAP
jgi:hypothetical protein